MMTAPAKDGVRELAERLLAMGARTITGPGQEESDLKEAESLIREAMASTGGPCSRHQEPCPICFGTIKATRSAAYRDAAEMAKQDETCRDKDGNYIHSHELLSDKLRRKASE